MAERLELKVITPSRVVISEEVDEVIAPGELGEFGVLPGHVPFITLLMPGELKYRKDGTERRFIVWGGLSEVRDDKVTVLTDNVEDPRFVDSEAAQREAEALLEELKSFSGKTRELKEINKKLRLAQLKAGIKE
ncbi:MAG TPA: ATP synthase F1 subunit epsilon [Thermodesulfobacteriota bacterium]|nr:ATP synthase F1 subunit epsilon [Thermodesulfobacteriota bacterium]